MIESKVNDIINVVFPNADIEEFALVSDMQPYYSMLRNCIIKESQYFLFDNKVIEHHLKKKCFYDLQNNFNDKLSQLIFFSINLINQINGN